MFLKKRSLLTALSLLLVMAMLLAACQTAPVEVEPEPDEDYIAQECQPPPHNPQPASPTPQDEEEPEEIEADPNIEFEYAPAPSADDGTDPNQMPPVPISTALFTDSNLQRLQILSFPVGSFPYMDAQNADYAYRLDAQFAAQFFSGIDLGTLIPTDAADPSLTDTGPQFSS